MLLEARFKCHKHTHYTGKGIPRKKCKACATLYSFHSYKVSGEFAFPDKSILTWSPVGKSTKHKAISRS